MMAGIRGKDTKPERLIRHALHARGLRYRLHASNVPGRPDLIFPRFRAAVFIHGCFWHGHACPFFRLPDTRSAFWTAKFDRNRARDADVAAMLMESGWRRLVVWECAIRGRGRLPFENGLSIGLFAWLKGSADTLEIRGLN